MSKTKQPADVLGNKINCIRFNQCPVCYGCRSYDSSNLECLKCIENKKFNICNKEIHNDKITADFITRNKIQLNDDISFK